MSCRDARAYYLTTALECMVICKELHKEIPEKYLPKAIAALEAYLKEELFTPEYNGSALTQHYEQARLLECALKKEGIQKLLSDLKTKNVGAAIKSLLLLNNWALAKYNHF